LKYILEVPEIDEHNRGHK